MNKKIKLEIDATSEVNTYAHLRQANFIMTNLIKKDTPGGYYLAMSSIILSAFTFEAYCNHLG